MPEDKLICGNCGAELTPAAKFCPKCGADPRKAVKFCTACGEPITNPNAIICTKCGAALKGGAAPAKGGGAPGEMDPLIATVISLFIPGLGLYFIWPEESKGKAVLITAVLIIADLIFGVIGGAGILGLVGNICICCFASWLAIPVINIASAVFTYNEAMKVRGGKALF